MKFVISGTLSILLTVAAGIIQAQSTPATSTPSARTPLRPFSDCIRTDQLNEWHVVDPQTLLVRTGPKRYLVKLTASCPKLGIGNGALSFKSNRSNNAIAFGRICGEVGESVRSRYQPPCSIQSVSIIEQAQFDQLKAQAERHGNGASQPTRMAKP